MVEMVSVRNRLSHLITRSVYPLMKSVGVVSYWRGAAVNKCFQVSYLGRVLNYLVC